MTEKLTCGTCAHIGQQYWGSAWDYGGHTHFCKKEPERRRDTMKPTGDFAMDFMENFRTFFDAKAHNTACKYYEEREPLADEMRSILVELLNSDGKAAFAFFSKGNGLCEKMDGKFVVRDDCASRQRKPSDGTRDWQLTEVGRAEARRLVLVSEDQP